MAAPIGADMNAYYQPNDNRADFIRIIRNVGDENEVTFTDTEIDTAVDANLAMLDNTPARQIKGAEIIALSILDEHGIRPRHLNRVHRVRHQPFTTATVIPPERFQQKLQAQRIKRLCEQNPNWLTDLLGLPPRHGYGSHTS
jgi:hypothetical protein